MQAMVRAARTHVIRPLPLSVLLTALMLPYIGVLPAFACSGSRLLIDGDAESAAKAIFTGTVVRRDDVLFRLSQPAEQYLWTLVVDEVEKGRVEDTMVVASPRLGASCGMKFELGGRYRGMAYEGSDPTWLEVISGDAVELPPLANPPKVEGAFGIPGTDAVFRLATDPLVLVILFAIGAIAAGMVVSVARRGVHGGDRTT